jgi:heterodisulfide reductase subunit C
MTKPVTPPGDLHRKVLATEPGQGLARCVACGTCASGCPVHAQHPDFDPRRIIRAVLMGLENELLDSQEIWLCSTCYTCLERCPQEVGCAGIITELRNLAAAEGRAPEGFRLQLQALRTYGRVYEIEEFDNKKREKLGLTPLETRVDLEPFLGKEETE